jgi:hypothetical protein
MGVANLRGGLFGVVDLAGFVIGKASARRDNPRDEARLVAFNATLDLNCALWVDRLAGLRSLERLKPLADEGVSGMPLPVSLGDCLKTTLAANGGSCVFPSWPMSRLFWVLLKESEHGTRRQTQVAVQAQGTCPAA